MSFVKPFRGLIFGLKPRRLLAFEISATLCFISPGLGSACMGLQFRFAILYN